MRAGFVFYLGIGLGLLCGCATQEPPVVVEDAETMLHLGGRLRPENLLFPEYLFMADFELDQHGRIPDTFLVGADLKTELGLAVVLSRFTDVLTAEGWEASAPESTEHSFRLFATLGEATLEIRAVQGTGSTQVFILYQPEYKPLETD